MKKLSFIALVITLFTVSVNSQETEIIQLPEPEKEGGRPLMTVLKQRHSSRSFANKELTDQQLSNLLWAAFGINRPESGKRTAPSSHNVQDIQIYLATADGAFLYLPEKHALKQITNQDVRGQTGTQEFVKDAAVNLVYVSDFSMYSGGSEQVRKITAGAHCGFIGQNVYLFCASEELNVVFRASLNKGKIANSLNLNDSQHIMYSQSVGFPK